MIKQKKSHWLAFGLTSTLVAILSTHVASGQESRGPELKRGEFVELLTDSELSGWVVESGELDGPSNEPNWSLQDGVLRCAGRGFGFLRYDRLLCDFVLRLEFRIFPGGNSGVGFRSVKYVGNLASRPSIAGYEVQILDDYGSQPSARATGSLYRYVAPSELAIRETGKWNEMEIACRGPMIRIKLNGQVIQDLDQTESDAIKNKPLRGYILLQCHRTPVEFRNVRILDLGCDNLQ